MHRIAFIFAAAITAVFVSHSMPAQAQNARTFVSGKGTDTGGCGVTAPCRSFAYAVTQTANAGEIVVLDSAGYGAVTITQSLTITNPGGVEAGVTATAGNNAVTINTTGAAVITLRGLTLEGGGVGNNGIKMAPTLPDASHSFLYIIGCTIKDFAGSALSLAISSPESGTPFLDIAIADSFLLNNTTNGLSFANGNRAPTTGTIYNTVIDGNGTGVNIGFPSSSPTLTLVNSHVDLNTTTGIAITTGASVTMQGSTVLYTNNGFNADISNDGGTISLYLANSVSNLNDTGGNGTTDGTNHIGAILGTALTRVNPQ